ncbi:multidrug effflux MFS transporter [Kitasatospora sp. GP82]|uniref:multidrug effflux MFS transporter n=1 Tax=Kitasatospora sp. GP82 TaxID=3035089 RepID=UPI0024768975|nr:multidrug effflux MFS transporter [Kitasatospora sp. GP82]MDH6125625.1 DHA1 family bicyclomycin/chloramphenicol resistance-like MFS transporter [Kitasatospora sp. GP82]
MPGPTLGATGDQSSASTADTAAGTTAALADTPAAPPNRATVVVLGGLTALGPLTTDLYLPAVPALTGDLGSTAATVQLTLTGSMFGMAFGQLLFGPLSDRLGRRRPLLVGMTVYTLATVVCALASSVPMLIAGRLLQGFAGAAGLVIARAVARDRYEGVAMIRFLASLGVISGLAPILAPVLGAQLLRFTSWRGTFVALAVLGALVTAGAVLALRESLPPERRHADGLGSTVRAIGGLLRDSRFLGYTLTSTFGFGALFAYVSGSSSVLQSEYAISPQMYSLVFAVNSIAVVGFTQLNGRLLVQKLPPPTLMLIGLGGAGTAGAAIVLFTTVWHLGLPGLWPALFVLMGSMGIVLPNSGAQALTMAPHAAGSASALLGTGTFLCGALVAPLSSAGGRPSAALLGIVVLSCAVLASVAFTVLCRPWRKEG